MDTITYDDSTASDSDDGSTASCSTDDEREAESDPHVSTQRYTGYRAVTQVHESVPLWRMAAFQGMKRRDWQVVRILWVDGPCTITDVVGDRASRTGKVLAHVRILKTVSPCGKKFVAQNSNKQFHVFVETKGGLLELVPAPRVTPYDGAVPFDLLASTVCVWFSAFGCVYVYVLIVCNRN
jgi:hypothetical protein